jgi:hypothetical protein
LILTLSNLKATQQMGVGLKTIEVLEFFGIESQTVARNLQNDPCAAPIINMTAPEVRPKLGARILRKSLSAK